MSKKIEICLGDKLGESFVKIDGESVPCSEILVHGRAGHRPEVWMRLVTQVEGHVTVKTIGTGEEGDPIKVTTPVEVILRQIHDEIKGLQESITTTALPR